MSQTMTEYEVSQGAMRRFMLLGQCTMVMTGVMLVVLMLQFPQFELAYKVAMAFELGGICVMAVALCVGGLRHLRLWWSNLEQEVIREQSRKM